MTDDRTPETIANSILMRLDGGARRRDLTGVLDLFVDDAALFGSDAGEFARGRADLQDFLTTLFGEPITYGWTWDDPVADAAAGQVRAERAPGLRFWAGT